MLLYVLGISVISVIVITQLYTIVAAGTREYELEDREQEAFIREWREKHQQKV